MVTRARKQMWEQVEVPTSRMVVEWWMCSGQDKVQSGCGYRRADGPLIGQGSQQGPKSSGRTGPGTEVGWGSLAVEQGG